MDQQTSFIKKERKEFKYQEKLGIKETAAQKRRFKKIVSWGLGGGFVVALLGGFVWYIATRPLVLKSDLVSTNAFHWHPELVIYVKGIKQEIPADIGIGAVHQPMHTHEADGIIHLEFPGVARKQDVTIGQFFKNWGKDMRYFGVNMKMTVNGKENADYENYVMHDQDRIELWYE